MENPPAVMRAPRLTGRAQIRLVVDRTCVLLFQKGRKIDVHEPRARLNTLPGVTSILPCGVGTSAGVRLSARVSARCQDRRVAGLASCLAPCALADFLDLYIGN